MNAIRRCVTADVPDILRIINDGARAYEGVIPASLWTEPYMSAAKLAAQIADGIAFWGYEETTALVGVMGIQHVRDVTLIRHAYVASARQRAGVGTLLLEHLRDLAGGPILIGTWSRADWAISFYTKHGFTLTDRTTTAALLATYWSVPPGQVEASVVLADRAYFALHGNAARTPVT